MKAAKTRALNRKHAGTSKHAATAKHTPTASKKGATAARASVKRVALSASAAKARALSPGGVSCCSADAVAISARLAGWPVGAADVVELYRRLAPGPDAGASIWAVLAGAYRWGLAGVRPVSFDLVDPDDPGAVLLGLDLPEAPHAVCLDPSGAVWSWGGLHEMTGEAVIEEAWAVMWP